MRTGYRRHSASTGKEEKRQAGGEGIRNMKQVTIIGCGTGSPESMTTEGIRTLREAELIIGAGRLTDPLLAERAPGTFRVLNNYRTEEIVRTIREAKEERTAILVSGDSGFYSGAAGYAGALKEVAQVRILPGVSSICALSAKTGISWEDAQLYSLHGREQCFTGSLFRGDKFVLLGGGGFAKVLDGMCRLGYAHREVWIGECLGTDKERILHGRASELREKATEPLSVLMVAADPVGKCRTSGIDDGEFCRGEVPMTKSEVRSVVMSRLAPGRSDVIYDIGAGTGSVSVEAAIAAPYGSVYAIEKKREACDLIEKNREKFLARNIRILNAEAPEALGELPAPDRVFIGGSGGALKEILKQLLKKNPKVRIVLTAVTIETLREATEAFEDNSLSCTEITQIAATRYHRRGSYHMPEALSPVWVILGEGDPQSA